MTEGTFATSNFYLAAYLLTVINADLPEVTTDEKGRSTFVFSDPTGELAWAEQAYLMDATVQKFCKSLKRLKILAHPEQVRDRSHGAPFPKIKIR